MYDGVGIPLAIFSAHFTYSSINFQSRAAGRLVGVVFVTPAHASRAKLNDV